MNKLFAQLLSKTGLAWEDRPVPVAGDRSWGADTPKTEAEKEICGIDGCPTSYSDPLVMRRHRERVHGGPARSPWRARLPDGGPDCETPKNFSWRNLRNW